MGLDAVRAVTPVWLWRRLRLARIRWRWTQFQSYRGSTGSRIGCSFGIRRSSGALERAADAANRSRARCVVRVAPSLVEAGRGRRGRVRGPDDGEAGGIASPGVGARGGAGRSWKKAAASSPRSTRRQRNQRR